MPSQDREPGTDEWETDRERTSFPQRSKTRRTRQPTGTWNRTVPENGFGDAENPAAFPYAASATPPPVTKNVSGGVVMLFGIWKAGAVCAPLNPRLPAAELERLIADVKPSVVVKPSNDEESLVPQVVARVGEARHYDDGIALIMTTSGTTGPPKRVLLEHESVLASVDSALNKIRGGAPRDPDAPRRAPMPNLVPMPLALWAGIYNTLFAARVGAAVILLHPFSTAEFAAAMKFAISVSSYSCRRLLFRFLLYTLR